MSIFERTSVNYRVFFNFREAEKNSQQYQDQREAQLSADWTQTFSSGETSGNLLQHRRGAGEVTVRRIIVSKKVYCQVNPTANIYSQVSSLVRLQLLTAVGLEMMDQPKYKCNVSMDFIRTVAKTVQFDVYKYLFDH